MTTPNMFESTVDDLHLDDKNAVLHPEKNLALIQKSIEEVGMGRSIVIDETGKVLAGNGSLMSAKAAGKKRVVVVQGDRDTIIAVQRTDLTPTEKTRLALADNRSSDEHKWNQKVLKQLATDVPEQHLLDGLFDARDLHRFHKAQENAQELSAGGDESEPELAVGDKAEYDASRALSAQVRMVQLYFSMETQPIFVSRVRALSKFLNTENITDTVLAVVEKAAKEWLATQ